MKSYRVDYTRGLLTSFMLFISSSSIAQLDGCKDQFIGRTTDNAPTLFNSSPDTPYKSNKHLCYRDDDRSFFAVEYWPEQYAPRWAAYKLSPQNYGKNGCNTLGRKKANCYYQTKTWAEYEACDGKGDPFHADYMLESPKLGKKAFANTGHGSAVDSGITKQVLGLMDLSTQGMAKKHWRPIWPEQFGGVDSASGDPDYDQNVAFIGGDSISDLTDATNYYIKGTATDNGCCAFLSGRTIVIPEISVMVNGRQHWVSVGCSLRELLSEEAAASMMQMTGPAAAQANNFHASIKRWDQSSDGSEYQQVNVQLPAASAVIFDQDGNTQWDLPLMMGDQIEFQSQS